MGTSETGEWAEDFARVHLESKGFIFVEGNFRTKGGEWERIGLALTEEQFRAHWGGAKDGRIHFPLRSVLVAASPAKGGKGSFWLRDVAVRVARPERTWRIDVTTALPLSTSLTDWVRLTPLPISYGGRFGRALLLPDNWLRAAIEDRAD